MRIGALLLTFAACRNGDVVVHLLSSAAARARATERRPHALRSHGLHERGAGPGLRAVGLPDPYTGLPAVRQRIADYLTGLARLGVAGFRIDAAKHIQQTGLDDIVDRVNAALSGEGRPRPYIFLEIGAGAGEALSQLDPDGPPGGCFSEAAWGLIPSGKAVVFLQNHDTRHRCGIAYRDRPVGVRTPSHSRAATAASSRSASRTRPSPSTHRPRFRRARTVICSPVAMRAAGARDAASRWTRRVAYASISCPARPWPSRPRHLRETATERTLTGEAQV